MIPTTDEIIERIEKLSYPSQLREHALDRDLVRLEFDRLIKKFNDYQTMSVEMRRTLTKQMKEILTMDKK